MIIYIKDRMNDNDLYKKNKKTENADNDNYEFDNILCDLLLFIDVERFDSDAIRFDIDDIDNNNCNIFKNINNGQYIECIKQFIKNYNIKSTAFSTGIS